MDSWVLGFVWIAGWTVLGAVCLVLIFWLVFLLMTLLLWVRERLWGKWGKWG
jgi:hypothetical protein